jgi:hypothetical protein
VEGAKSNYSNSYLWTYNLYGPIRNAIDAGKSITRASGRGLGPGNRDFFGPCEIALSRQVSAIWGPKRPYQSEVHMWFYVHEPPRVPLMGYNAIS